MNRKEIIVRDIVFRGKCKEKWIYGNLIIDGAGNPHINTLDEKIDPETVGQYTGMRDKNGQRIFEGDIIEANNGHKGYVKFVDGQFNSFCYCHGGAGCDIYSDNARVIGNIYDNPELLEKDAKKGK